MQLLPIRINRDILLFQTQLCHALIFFVPECRMEQRIIDIFQRAYPNEKTRDNYLSRLRNLQKKFTVPLTRMLEDPDTHYTVIQEAYPSITTRKNMLTTILVIFREDEELRTKHAEAGARWKKLHDDLAKHQDAKIRRSEPEDKQIEKYTSYEEIEKKYRELAKGTPHTSERNSMQFMLLSILVHLRPKRADLGAVRIIRGSDPQQKDQNYIVLRKPAAGSSYLVMNMYKTSKHYRTVEEEMPAALVRDLETSLKRWPREFLFRKDDGEPMTKNNTYSRFVMTTFEDMFGRSTGVSLLRHIYISEKLELDNMTIEEQDAEAKLMLHTSGLQRQYKWPKKVLCPKLCAAYIKPTKKTLKAKRKSRRQEEL